MDTKSVLDDFIVFATAKYGDPKITVKAINGYLEGIDTHITSDGGFRDKFKALNRNEVWSIMSGTPEFYVKQVLENRLDRSQPLGLTEEMKPTVSTQQKPLTVDTYNRFLHSCYQTAMISPRQLMIALKSAETGNFIYMADGEILSNLVAPSDIKRLCVVGLRNANVDLSRCYDEVAFFADMVNNTVMQQQEQQYNNGKAY